VEQNRVHDKDVVMGCKGLSCSTGGCGVVAVQKVFGLMFCGPCRVHDMTEEVCLWCRS